MTGLGCYVTTGRHVKNEVMAEIALIDRVLGGEYPSKGAAFPRSIRSIQVSDRVTPTQPKAIYCPVVTLLALPR